METKQIKDLRPGDIYTNVEQFKGHLRIFIGMSELQHYCGLNFVFVSYKYPDSPKIYKSEYSENWEVWVYRDTNF